MGDEVKIRISCSGCGKSLSVPSRMAGKSGKCPGCGNPILIPEAEADLHIEDEKPRPVARARAIESAPPRSRRRPRRREDDRPNPGDHQLARMHPAFVILLNCLTVGLFTSIWFNLMHGKMPKLQASDPSAGRAIGFLFIPFYNFYWFFFTYNRLVTRINEQREFRGLPPSNLHWLVISFCIIHLVSGIILSFSMPTGLWINPISMVLMAIVFSIIQCRVNELVEASELVPAPKRWKVCPDCEEQVKASARVCNSCDYEFEADEIDRGEPEIDAATQAELERIVYRHRRGLCLTWGWTSAVIALIVGGLTMPYVLGNTPKPHPDLPERIVGAACFVFPFLLSGAICLWRARNYSLKLKASTQTQEDDAD